MSHSLSPAIHNPLFSGLGKDALYLAMECGPEDLAAVLPAFLRLPFDGLNLTYPLKESALPFLAEVAPSARRLESVNTLVRTPAGWKGLSTDGPGLVLALREGHGFEPRGRRVVVLGAGGAARAAAAALLEEGEVAGLAVVNRSPERFGLPFFDWLRARGGECLPLAHPEVSERLRASDLVVHATSFGLEGGGAAPPWDLRGLRPGTLVLDMNYRLGRDTPLLAALPPGQPRADGRGMLAGQAVLAFEVWTGHRPAFAEAVEAAGLEVPCSPSGTPGPGRRS